MSDRYHHAGRGTRNKVRILSITFEKYMILTIGWSDLILSRTYTLDLVAPCTLQAIYYDKFLELIENLGNFRIKSEVEKTF